MTSQTQASGGPIDPEQAKLRFESADLSFELLPETETLRGTARSSTCARPYPARPAPRTRCTISQRAGPKPGGRRSSRAACAASGRLDPQPGNFTLRQAALPELIETRSATRLSLRWQAPAGRPFPLSIEVQVDGRIVRVPMAGGTGSIAVPRSAHVVVDPQARLLRRSRAIEEYGAWHDAQPKR